MIKKVIISSIVLLGLASCGTTENIVESNPINENITKKEINIITDRSDVHLSTLIDKFEKETDIKVNVSSIEEGLLEKIENRNEGDIFISKNSTIILSASNKGLLGNIDTNITENVPTLNKGEKNDWFNMSSRIRAIYIKKGLEDYPKTYEELSDSKYKGQICIRSLSHNYNIELASYIYVKYGEEYTKKWLQGLYDNLGRSPAGNDRNQVKGIVEDKVCDIAVVNTYYMGLMLQDLEQRNWANGVDMYIPNQGDDEGGAISLYSAVGIAKNLDNKEEVNQFLKFLLDPINQQFLSAINFEYPVIGKSESPMVQSFTKFQGIETKDIKNTNITQDEIAEVREKVLLLIKTIEK